MRICEEQHLEGVVVVCFVVPLRAYVTGSGCIAYHQNACCTHICVSPVEMDKINIEDSV